MTGWLAYSAQHRTDPLRHARANPNTVAGVSAYFDVTAACGQQARIPVGPRHRDTFGAPWDPDHPRACARCAKITRAQPWPAWRWSAHRFEHDPTYRAAVEAVLHLLRGAR